MDVGGEWLVQCEVLWKVPPELLEQRRWRRQWNVAPDDWRSQGEVKERKEGREGGGREGERGGREGKRKRMREGDHTMC